MYTHNILDNSVAELELHSMLSTFLVVYTFSQSRCFRNLKIVLGVPPREKVGKIGLQYEIRN